MKPDYKGISLFIKLMLMVNPENEIEASSIQDVLGIKGQRAKLDAILGVDPDFGLDKRKGIDYIALTPEAVERLDDKLTLKYGEAS